MRVLRLREHQLCLHRPSIGSDSATHSGTANNIKNITLRSIARYFTVINHFLWCYCLKCEWNTYFLDRRFYSFVLSNKWHLSHQDKANLRYTATQWWPSFNICLRKFFCLFFSRLHNCIDLLIWCDLSLSMRRQHWCRFEYGDSHSYFYYYWVKQMQCNYVIVIKRWYKRLHNSLMYITMYMNFKTITQLKHVVFVFHPPLGMHSVEHWWIEHHFELSINSNRNSKLVKTFIDHQICDKTVKFIWISISLISWWYNFNVGVWLSELLQVSTEHCAHIS